MKWKYSDFEKSPELSPDLEWMVQSGQVSSQMFLETLVKDYFAPVYRMALSLLNDISAAGVVSRDIFSQAVIKTHRYRDQAGIDAWVYQIAFQTVKKVMRREYFWRGFEGLVRLPGQFTNPLKNHPTNENDRLIWQEVDRLSDDQRIPVVLYYANGWTNNQIADTLKVSPERIDELLQSSLNSLTQSLGDNQVEEIEKELRISLTQRYPLPEPTGEEIQQFIQKVEKHTGKRRILGRGMTTTREIVILGIALLMVILAIWGGNHFLFQSASDAASPGSRLDAGGLGIIQNWMEASLLLVGLGQAASENPLDAVRDEVDSTQSGNANSGAIKFRYEDCRPPYICDVSWGRYSAFKNKDRIRRFRQSQYQQNGTVAPANSPAEGVISPLQHEQVEPR